VNIFGGGFAKGVFWGVVFVLGGIACIVYGLVKSPSKNDVQHGICPQGPCTTYRTPWAWELGGGVLILTGAGRAGWAWHLRRDDVPADG
jgi:hypothetical protein